jgi:hypothetical protein
VKFVFFSLILLLFPKFLHEIFWVVLEQSGTSTIDPIRDDVKKVDKKYGQCSLSTVEPTILIFENINFFAVFSTLFKSNFFVFLTAQSGTTEVIR